MIAAFWLPPLAVAAAAAAGGGGGAAAAADADAAATEPAAPAEDGALGDWRQIGAADAGWAPSEKCGGNTLRWKAYCRTKLAKGLAEPEPEQVEPVEH